LAEAGADPAELVGEVVWGADIDPAAVAVARLSLGWWAWRAGAGRYWPPAAGSRLVVADALVDDTAWPARRRGRPWAVVGNPPFLGQLSGATARSRSQAARLAARHGRAARGYVDGAVLFLLAACRHGRAGDRVLLIQPESALVTADGTAARGEVLERGRLVGLWLGGAGVFAAGVRVCAPLVELGAPHRRAGGDVRLWRGVDVEAAPPAGVPPAELSGAPTWGAAAAGSRGVPARRPACAGVVGDLAATTAGFRDQYYGLVPLVVEWPEGESAAACSDTRRWAPVVTSGLIAPAVCHWARRPARFAGRTWAAPVVDRAALDAEAALSDPAGARLARWVLARLRPKLVLATQAPVLAAAPDPVGLMVPSVPVVAVEPHDPGRLWHLLAALSSPVASAWAAEHFGGAGLGASSLKLSARQVSQVPLPADDAAWDRAAVAYRSAASQPDAAGWRRSLVAAARLANDAYRLPAGEAAAVLAWWEGRLPSWHRVGRPAAVAPAPGSPSGPSALSPLPARGAAPGPSALSPPPARAAPPEADTAWSDAWVKRPTPTSRFSSGAA
jgi:hypothetical protein